MSIQFYPKGDILADHGVRWGDYHASGRRRGSAVFFEVRNENHVSPAYWADVQADGSYAVWGSAQRKGKCASDTAAVKAVEAFVEAEYKRMVGLEVAKLEATVAEIMARM